MAPSLAQPGPTWTVRTEVFEGPMDLLLHLVRRDGVDLSRVSIVRVADSYLAFLERMRDLHLSIAGEYLVMAATLCHLKSLSLLPRAPTPTSDDGEAVDPTEQLAERLREYERYRTAARTLDDRVVVGRDVVVREPMTLEGVPRPVFADVDAFGLLEIYASLVERLEAEPEEPRHVVGEVGPDLEGCARRVLQVLHHRGGRGSLRDALLGLRTRADRLVTFLSVLEMTRLGWLLLEQAGHLTPVLLTARVSPDVDLEPLVGRLRVMESPRE